jgi:hypothetical protein
MRTLLTALRRLANWMGDLGGLLLIVIALSYSFSLIGPKSGGVVNAVGLAGVILTMTATFARNLDGEGHAGMRRLAKRSTAQKPSEKRRLCAALLGLSPTETDPDAINERTLQVLFDAKNSAEGEGADMDLVVKARDHMLTDARDAFTSFEPTDEELLDAWRRNAMFLGQAWGALLPSPKLIRLKTSTGRSLWPSSDRGSVRS